MRVEVERIERIGRDVKYLTSASATPDASSQPKTFNFPEAAWRGPFGEYREAMDRATEANDAFHFATLWARAAVALGRRVRYASGGWIYPNVYLVVFGATGDRKTTAIRKVYEIGGEFKLIRGGGSGEGIADEFAAVEPGTGLLIYVEEFSSILRPGQWQGATLIPFLTETFDCPPRYEAKYRKKPINIERPTPSMIAATTSDWFWRDFRISDFQGGYGNRIFFFTGEQKAPNPRPDFPDTMAAAGAIGGLETISPCTAVMDVKAGALWDEFYFAWADEDRVRDPLLISAVRRIPSYVQKLAMTYAAFEGSLPKITLVQLAAAIEVGRYGEMCVQELLALQNAGTNARKELERRILACIAGERSYTTKRAIYRKLWRHYSDTEAFNRAFDSLGRAGEIFCKPAWHGKVLVSLEPFD